MKTITKLLIISLSVYIFIMLSVNLIFSNSRFENHDRIYRVSINRLENDIIKYESLYGKCPENLSKLKNFSGQDYESVDALYSITLTDDKNGFSDFFNTDNRDQYVFATENHLYKTTYTAGNPSYGNVLNILNVIITLIFIFILVFLIYLRQNIFLPFNKFTELPYELSKGNLTIPLKENKNRIFGKFLWGMDLLRENLEENKAKELKMQREQKMLLLSLSHDIKTPLSAIKLYSKALTKNLYKSSEKKKEIAENISLKADEIECYISKIVKASNEDFLSFEVNNSEFYIKDVFDNIYSYYYDKMEINLIDFSIGSYDNCLLYGDAERLIEVIQNVIENAIKYGDGKKIWIETSHSNEEYSIRISNTGCTLPQKELVHLFDSFFRGSNTDKQQGSGLGLYICRCLMHLMEGGITADMESSDGMVMMVNIVLRVA